MLEKTKINEKEAGDGQFILKQLYTGTEIQGERERKKDSSGSSGCGSVG